MADDDERAMNSESDEEARIEAALSLSSSAPQSLAARVAARRARGDRVILPVPGEASGTARSHRLRRFAIPAMLAAAVVLVALAIRSATTRPLQDGDSRGVARAPAIPSSGRDTAVAPSPAPTVAVRPGARHTSLATHSDSGEFGVGFSDPTARRVVHTLRLEQFRASAIDSAADFASHDPSASIVVGYPSGSVALDSLAHQMERALVRAGVDPHRMHVREAKGAPAATMSASITIVSGKRLP